MINWAEESKRKDIDKLLEMVSKEKNKARKSYILQVINKTRRNLEIENLSDLIITKPTNTILFELLEENISFQRYYALVDTFSNFFEQYEIETQTNLDTISTIDLKKYDRRLSDEETFTLVHDFYLNTDSIFSNLFSKYINEKYTTIKFSKDEPLLDNYGCDGLNFFVDILMKNYILVRDTDGYSKATLLSHELGHAVSLLYAPKALYTYQDTFLTEVASLFFELAFNNDIIMKQSGIIGAEHSISVLENITVDVEYLLMHDMILEKWKNNNYKVNNDFHKKVKEEIGITRKAVFETIHTSISEEGIYIISYILALYLLKIYKQDKKFALRLLREIIGMHQQDSLITLNSILPSLDEIKSEIELINNTVTREVQKILK